MNCMGFTIDKGSMGMVFAIEADYKVDKKGLRSIVKDGMTMVFAIWVDCKVNRMGLVIDKDGMTMVFAIWVVTVK